MKATELIKELQEAVANEGDLEVFVFLYTKRDPIIGKNLVFNGVGKKDGGKIFFIDGEEDKP